MSSTGGDCSSTVAALWLCYGCRSNHPLVLSKEGKMKSTKKVVGSLAIAACTAVMAVVGSTPSASALEQGDKYVALGDSYASVGSLTSPPNLKIRHVSRLLIIMLTNWPNNVDFN